MAIEESQSSKSKCQALEAMPSYLGLLYIYIVPITSGSTLKEGLGLRFDGGLVKDMSDALGQSKIGRSETANSRCCKLFEGGAS